MNQNSRLRIVIAAAALIGSSAVAGAQQLVGFGTAEAGGLGSSLFLLGLSASGRGMDWQPTGTLEGYYLRFGGGSGSTVTQWVFAPSVGLKDAMKGGAIQARVGYSIVNSSTNFGNTTFPSGTFPVATGSKNGVFVVGQGDYWGDGNMMGQAIATYNFGTEFLWSRLRGAEKLSNGSPIMIGGEVGYLGGGTSDVPGFTKTWGYFLGPLVSYQFTPAFRGTLFGGYRNTTNSGGVGSGYLGVDGVYLFP